MNNTKIGGVIAGIIMVLVVILFVINIHIIPAGYVGVRYNINKGVEEKVLGQGWHITPPTVKVKTYTVGLEQSYLTKKKKGDSKKDESFSASSSEGKALQIDLTYSYQFKADKVSEVFTRFKGQDGEDVRDRFIKPNIVSWTKEVISRYKVSDILGSERANVNAALTEYLADKFEEYGITISNVSLIDITVDGVDINTDEAVQKLLGKITDITDAVTGAETQAQLQGIELKYSGKEMTGDTFQALAKDIQKYEKQVTSGAQEAYQTSMTNLNARLQLGDINKKQYNAEKSKLEEGYYKTRAEAYSKGADYITGTIQQAYPEMKPAMEQVSQKMDAALKSAMDKGLTGRELDVQMQSIAEESIKGLNIDKTTKRAIQELFQSGLSDIYEQMTDMRSEITNAGYEMPESLSKSIESTDTIFTAAGDKTNATALLGDKIGSNADYSAMVQAAAKTGGTVPENMADGILAGKNKVSYAVNALFDQVEMTARNRQMAVETVKIDTGSASRASDSLSGTKIRSTATTYHDKNGDHTIYRNALGGIYDREILTTVAEEGAEAIIPLDGSDRGKNLWWKAGEMMGLLIGGNRSAAQSSPASAAPSLMPAKMSFAAASMPKKDVAAYESLVNSGSQKHTETHRDTTGGQTVNAGQPITVTYAPNIVIEGNADQKTVEKALDISQKKFEQLMERYQRSHKRISFGGAS